MKMVSMADDKAVSDKLCFAKELQFKVLVIGEFGVGKTAVIRRYTEGQFSPNYKLTIGVDFAVKRVILDNRTKVNLQLWDIAGHERFGQLTRIYYKYAVAAIVVFDLTRPESFVAVNKWVTDIRDKVVPNCGSQLPIFLLANKCDVEGIDIDTAFINEFCDLHRINKWFLTSAKDNINIDTAMQYLLCHILEQHVEPPGPNSALELNNRNNDNTKATFSCCS